jgi:hypothetical protein
VSSNPKTRRDAARQKRHGDGPGGNILQIILNISAGGLLWFLSPEKTKVIAQERPPPRDGDTRPGTPAAKGRRHAPGNARRQGTATRARASKPPAGRRHAPGRPSRPLEDDTRPGVQAARWKTTRAQAAPRDAPAGIRKARDNARALDVIGSDAVRVVVARRAPPPLTRRRRQLRPISRPPQLVSTRPSKCLGKHAQAVARKVRNVEDGLRYREHAGNVVL